MSVLVKLKTVAIWRCYPVRFFPGINEVEDAQWDQIKDHPLLKKKMEMGQLELVQRRKPKGSEEAAQEPERPALEAMAAKKAIAVIEEIFNVDSLKKILLIEKRSGVRYAIEKQIASIEDEILKKKAQIEAEKADREAKGE
jgi:hypothetical protein